MLKNYLKSALRNIVKHRVFAAVNIAGLAIGIACSILILIYAQYELSYDRFHKNADQIYRVLVELDIPEGLKLGGTESSLFNATPNPLPKALRGNFPEVIQAASFGRRHATLRYRGEAYFDHITFFAEPEFLGMMTFPLISGDSKTALREPYTVVLTQETATRMFGDEDPIGQFIQYGSVYELKVTGVCEDVPANSHMHFDCLASAATIIEHSGESAPLQQGMTMIGRDSQWQAISNKTYVQLAPSTDVAAFEVKFNEWVKQFYTDEERPYYRFQAMTDIHLHGHAGFEFEENSDARYVYFVAGIAALILLIACFNYMNLSTARSAGRAREVGMRKVVGATRFSLIKQFLGESILLSLIALMLAVLVVEFALPAFSTLIGTHLEIDWLRNHQMLLLLAGLMLLVGVVAGSYPALLLSSFRPMNILKGSFTVGSSASRWFRNLLVVFQYGISIVLMSCTAVVFQQLDFIRDTDVGFETENVVAVPIRDYKLMGSFNGLKKELLAHPGITDLATAATYPSQSGGSAMKCWWENQEPADVFPFNWTDIDYNFIPFYGLELVDGRNFSRDFGTDEKKGYILNETAVRKLGWADPVGKRFGLHKNRKGTVVGVVKDFHFASLHEEIKPMALMLSNKMLRSLAVKVDPEQMPQTLDFIAETWKKYSSSPFSYYFFDDRIAAQYDSERSLFTIFTWSTGIAILVACLGLFGLATFTAQERVQEIGIRKVMGATVSGIVALLMRQFSKWVIVAAVVSWPFAYWAMDRWLQDYSYRITLGWGPFVLAGVAALMVATLTVSWQSFRAAHTNPVETLRRE